MPAGGTWLVQNKRRPGAYINFISVPKPLGTLGERGTVAIGLPMTWGAENEIIKLTGDELLNGKSLAKVGCVATDTEASLPYRVALSGCFTALLFRTDSGGAKATGVIKAETLTVSAKYAGTVGNSIVVAVAKSDKSTEEEPIYNVQVLVNTLLQETHEVSKIADFEDIESNFVTFEVLDGEAAVPETATAGAPLAGGTNGTLNRNLYPTFWGLLGHKNFQALAMFDNDPTVAPLIKSQIKLWRENWGKKVQGVVYDYTAADYEGIISVDQGFKTQVETVTPELFVLWAASQTAGANVNQSLTNSIVEGAVEIINPVDENDIADELGKGRFLLTYNEDEEVVVEQDINSLHHFTVDKNDAWGKNRVIRVLDEIGNTTKRIFNRSYSGKVDNDDPGRGTFKAELINMVESLQGIHAIQNFEGTSDITVLPGEAVDAVVVDMEVQPVDAMEKLYMTVNVNA